MVRGFGGKVRVVAIRALKEPGDNWERTFDVSTAVSFLVVGELAGAEQVFDEDGVKHSSGIQVCTVRC